MQTGGYKGVEAAPDTHTISINQRIKRIKIFDCFDFLINSEVYILPWRRSVKTDENDMVLDHMAMIPFPVL